MSATITVVLGDQHCPESMLPMADGSFALVVRLYKITIEELNFYVLGPINNFGGNWENLKSFGISELLLKCNYLGNRVFLSVLSGTECVHQQA